jgi:hypothetical protein
MKLARFGDDAGLLAIVDTTLLSEIGHFFVSYNRFEGKTFEPIGRFGPRRAHRTVERSRGRPRTARRVRKKK